MKHIIRNLFMVVLLTAANNIHAQVYRGSSTEALRNSGGVWVQEKLPPSLLTFSDYSGQVKIKTTLASLFRTTDSLAVAQSPSIATAEFTMTLDKQQVKQQQASSGKTF